MNYTDKVIQQSNYWYNDGLARANIRDLSGAIVSLKRSLQYCRQNIMARNLLGLVYFGRGEINEALVEWIISKNLKPRDNVANYFIRRVEESAKQLDEMNMHIKKYNQCLAYCNQDAEDLALIQLKKVVSESSNFVKAYQLMAFLCIRKRLYSKASAALNKARKIDNTDPITLYYINELQEIKGVRKDDKEDAVTYVVGNETIIQPVAPSLKENAGTNSILNVIFGIMIGVAVAVFLVEPALNQGSVQDSAEVIREYSKQIDSQKAQINALKTELDSYRITTESAEADATTSAQIQSSYEALMKVNEQNIANNVSNATMAEELVKVVPTALSEEGTELYEALKDDIFNPLNSKAYEAAKTNISAEDYGSAITNLESIIRLEPEYDKYQAMLLLAQAYGNSGDQGSAEKYYNLIIQGGSTTEAATSAQEALSQ